VRIWAFLISLFLHAGIISVVFLQNILFSPKTPPVLSDISACSIPLEVTAVSEISCAPISRPKSEVSEPEPEKEVVQNVLPAPTPDPILEPAPEPTPDPIPEPAPEPTPDPIPEPAPEPTPDPIPEPAPVVAPIPKKQPKKEVAQPKTKKDSKKKDQKKSKSHPKKEKIKDVDPIAELLKKHRESVKKKPKISESINVNRDKDLVRGSSAETPITDPNSDSEYGAPAIGAQMSMSEMDRIQRLFEDAWIIPLRASEGGKLVIQVHITMNRDGTVNHAEILHDSSSKDHPVYPIGCDSVLRAVNQFRTESLPLRKETYAQWRDIVITFSPK
jgi:outer membrane biosynthesis protein TonB